MKRFCCAMLGIVLVVALFGCGDGGTHQRPALTVQVLSDLDFDGDIRFDPPNTYTISQGGLPSVFAGIDPATGSEFRAFLDFPLTGVVPGNALIASAVLEIYVSAITFQAGSTTLPIRIELVDFQPPNLVASDFERSVLLPLAQTVISPPLGPADVGRFVAIDVTPLMVEAQRRGLPDFQVRILEDLGPVIPGLVEISESNTRAPLLEVTFF